MEKNKKDETENEKRKKKENSSYGTKVRLFVLVNI